jgi:hypothetical protein
MKGRLPFLFFGPKTIDEHFSECPEFVPHTASLLRYAQHQLSFSPCDIADTQQRNLPMSVGPQARLEFHGQTPLFLSAIRRFRSK